MNIFFIGNNDLVDIHITMLDSAQYYMISDTWYPLKNTSVMVYGGSGENNTVQTGMWQELQLTEFNPSFYGNCLATQSM